MDTVKRIGMWMLILILVYFLIVGSKQRKDGSDGPIVYLFKSLGDLLTNAELAIQGR